MKERFLFLLFLTTNFLCFSQQKIEGVYYNEFGEQLSLKSDYSFEYKYSIDLASSWNIGKWNIIDKKYLILTVIEVKDKIIGKNQYVLSRDKVSDSITLQNYAIFSISGGGQSRSLPSKKFLIKNGILYPYSKYGILQDTKKQSLMNGNIMGKPWFEKEK